MLGSTLPNAEQGAIVSGGRYGAIPKFLVMCIETFIHTPFPMRTNIVIDDQLMAEALEASGVRTKREAVELGLRMLVMRGQQKAIRSLRGKLHWEGDLDEMRSAG